MIIESIVSLCRIHLCFARRGSVWGMEETDGSWALLNKTAKTSIEWCFFGGLGPFNFLFSSSLFGIQALFGNECTQPCAHCLMARGIQVYSGDVHRDYSKFLMAMPPLV